LLTVSGAGAHRASPGIRAWRAWGEWRRSRPFWGGLLVLLGGSEVLLTVWAPLGVVLHVGMQNFIGYLLPVVIVLLGLLLWFHPTQRVFYSIIAIMCALGSWLTSNMGGFLIGLLFTLVGGALAFAWAPTSLLAPTPAPAPTSPPTPAPAPSAAPPSGPLPGAQPISPLPEAEQPPDVR
jgi:hypothetical protein